MITETSAPLGPLLVRIPAPHRKNSSRSKTYARTPCCTIHWGPLQLFWEAEIGCLRDIEAGRKFLRQLPALWQDRCRSPLLSAGLTVAFSGPISGMAFIAEESAANLGGPIFYRALFGNCIALLVFNILVAAYNDQGYFWNSRYTSCRQSHSFPQLLLLA